VTDIEPDSKVKAAMNEVEQQRRLRIAAIEKGEGDKIRMIKAAGKKNQKIKKKGKKGSRNKTPRVVSWRVFLSSSSISFSYSSLHTHFHPSIHSTLLHPSLIHRRGRGREQVPAGTGYCPTEIRHRQRLEGECAGIPGELVAQREERRKEERRENRMMQPSRIIRRTICFELSHMPLQSDLMS